MKQNNFLNTALRKLCALGLFGFLFYMPITTLQADGEIVHAHNRSLQLVSGSVLMDIQVSSQADGTTIFVYRFKKPNGATASIVATHRFVTQSNLGALQPGDIYRGTRVTAIKDNMLSLTMGFSHGGTITFIQAVTGPGSGGIVIAATDVGVQIDNEISGLPSLTYYKVPETNIVVDTGVSNNPPISK